jgi:Fic family protein
LFFKELLMNTDDERKHSSRLRELLVQELAAHERKGVFALLQKSMAYNSNYIEGSTLTSEQTASLFDTGVYRSDDVYVPKDVEEAQGHFMMFDTCVKTLDEPLSPKLIKQFHFQLKSGVFYDRANGYPVGEFKNRMNIVSDILTSRPDSVAADVDDLLERYSPGSEHSLADIAAFHAAFEKIHPFQDGNGRVGRMIVFRECLRSGVFPVIIFDKSRYDYYSALHRAQTEGNMSPLVSLFERDRERTFDLVKDFL